MHCLTIDLFVFKQKTSYEMRISDWSSDVCSSDLDHVVHFASNRGDREFPLETHGDVEHDAGQNDQYRDHTVVGQFLADLRPDEFTALDCDPDTIGTQRLDHPLAQCRIATVETGFFHVGRDRKSTRLNSRH